MQRVLTARQYLSRPLISRSQFLTAQFIRLQHDGPHKEYFQNPSRMPLPETPTLPRRGDPLHDFPQQRSLLKRILGNTALALWFLLFGYGVGISLTTSLYLQGPFEAGTEEESDMLDRISGRMNEYSAMDALLNDPAWEEQPMAPSMVSGNSGNGRNLVTGTLTGSKGIVQVFCSF